MVHIWHDARHYTAPAGKHDARPRQVELTTEVRPAAHAHGLRRAAVGGVAGGALPVIPGDGPAGAEGRPLVA
jgi:hypothetical protein